MGNEDYSPSRRSSDNLCSYIQNVCTGSWLMLQLFISNWPHPSVRPSVRFFVRLYYLIYLSIYLSTFLPFFLKNLVCLSSLYLFFPYFTFSVLLVLVEKEIFIDTPFSVNLSNLASPNLTHHGMHTSYLPPFFPRKILVLITIVIKECLEYLNLLVDRHTHYCISLSHWPFSPSLSKSLWCNKQLHIRFWTCHLTQWI